MRGQQSRARQGSSALLIGGCNQSAASWAENLKGEFSLRFPSARFRFRARFRSRSLAAQTNSRNSGNDDDDDDCCEENGTKLASPHLF